MRTATTQHVQDLPLPDARWMFGQYRDTSVKEGAGADLKLSEVCWDANGFLTRKHVFRGLADQNDFLAVFEPDAQGNLITERHYSVPASYETCGNDSAGTALVTITNQWQYGALASSQYTGVDYKSKDFDIDASTGLPIFSRDGNGRATGLDYDLLGRLRVTRPPAEAETVYDYFMTERPVRVTARQKLASSNTSETETHYYYDGVGRLIQEKRRMPSGWATISTSYDLNGRKSSVTVPTFTSTSAYTALSQIPATTFLYDHLGRLTHTIAPDQSTLANNYFGDREIGRDSRVATIPGVTDRAQQTWFRTTELFDGFGRLVEVREPLPGGSQSTNYEYDFGDRLTSVINGQNPRTFQYDRSGLMIGDTHPERSAGTYTYDARGRLLTTRIGTTVSLLNRYDAAERLVEVDDQNAAGRPLKTFTYDVSGPVLERGKLLDQTRYNYFPDATYTVTDRFQYHAATGRLSLKETEVQTPTGSRKTQQQYTYDSFGQPAEIHFPVCSNCTGLPFGERTLPLTWHDGLLTGISRAATAIEYAPTGAVTRVVHATSDTNAATGAVDEYQQDPLGMARVARIKFTNVRDCTLILKHPASQPITPNSSAVFTIETAPGATIQWYQGVSGATGAPIAGATSATYSTPLLTQSTSYWARVISPGGECAEDSLTVTAAVCSGIGVTTPAATTARRVFAGDIQRFFVGVNGAVSYKWYWRIGHTGTPTLIPGNGPELFYAHPAAANPVEIFVVLEMVCGTTTDTKEHVVDILEVVARPQCVAEFDPVQTTMFPWSYTIVPNQSYLLDVRLQLAAASQEERQALDTTYPKRRYSFRWYQDGVLQQSYDNDWQAGATVPPDMAKSTYSFRFVNQSYARLEAWVSCYDSAGATQPAAVSAPISKQSYGVMNGHCPTPEVSVSPTSVMLPASPRQVVLKAESPYPDAIFQWYEGESGNTSKTAFNGGTSTLTVTDVGTYWVRVSSACGKFSDSPTVTVSDDTCQPVRILRDPQDATVAAGTPVPLSVDAASIPTPNYYLWFANGAAIEDTNGKKSITVVPIETTDYYVRVGNGHVYPSDCSLVDSKTARVHVTSCSDITIAAQPQDALLRATDTSVLLSIQATAGATLKYQWFQGESGDTSRPVDPVIGSGPSLLLTWADHLQQPGANKYWVRVSFQTRADAAALRSIASPRRSASNRPLQDSPRAARSRRARRARSR